MAEPDEPVISDVHMETCPPNTTSWCTRFAFSTSTPSQQQPPAAVTAAQTMDDTPSRPGEHADLDLDSDGDVCIPDRPGRKRQFVVIHHSVSTPVSRCGEQVWLGACLLCDFILSHPQLFSGQTVVELGAGVGMASITAALYADNVFLTDADQGALQLATQNVADNSNLWLHDQPSTLQHLSSQQRAESVSSTTPQGCSASGKVRIRSLDWLQLLDTQLSRLSWAEVVQLLNASPNRISKRTNAACSDFVDPLSQRHTAIADRLGSCQQQQPGLAGLQQDHPPLHISQDPQQQQQHQQQHQMTWQLDDLALLSTTRIWLAADVVYNETLTDAFIRTAYQLLTWQQQQQQQGLFASPGTASAGDGHARASGESTNGDSCRLNDADAAPRLFVAVEKRFNFTFRELDARASAFEHFMTYVKAVQGSLYHAHHLVQQHSSGLTEHELNSCARSTEGSGLDEPLFLGKRWDVSSIPQVVEYDRSGDLELWELIPVPG